MGGKSVSVVEIAIIFAMSCKKPTAILCLREIQRTIKDSIYAVVVEVIDRLGLDAFFHIKNDEIVCKANGVTFLFKGARNHNIETSIKSTYKVALTICDEAQVLTDKSLRVIEKTVLREDGSKIIYCANPAFVDDEFHIFLAGRTNRLTIPISWRDNIHLSKQGQAIALDCKKNRPQEYLEDFCGHFITVNKDSPFDKKLIDQHRVIKTPDKLTRICIGVDPNNGGKCDIGIIVCGFEDNHYYVIADESTNELETGLQKICELYKAFDADCVLIEKNMGGTPFNLLLKRMLPSMKTKVLTAVGGKKSRTTIAEDLYIKGKMHHVGNLIALEHQMLRWIPTDNDSPSDRIDALAHSVTWLHQNTNRVISGIIRVD